MTTNLVDLDPQLYTAGGNSVSFDTDKLDHQRGCERS